MKKILSICFCLAFCSGMMAQGTVQLPQPDVSKLSMPLGETLKTRRSSMPLGEALKTRRSYREYSNKEIDMATLSTLLWAATGISDQATGKITAPSAVNMQDVKVYVCTVKGVCRYDQKANTLVPVSDKNIIDALVAGQQFVKDAPMTLLLVSDQSNARRKNAHYGDIDTGYVSQNIYLACTALGLKTVARAMMDQDAIRTALNFSEDIIIELNHPIGY